MTLDGRDKLEMVYSLDNGAIGLDPMLPGIDGCEVAQVRKFLLGQ
jgi:hypothetical protein